MRSHLKFALRKAPEPVVAPNEAVKNKHRWRKGTDEINQRQRTNKNRRWELATEEILRQEKSCDETAENRCYEQHGADGNAAVTVIVIHHSLV